MQVKLSGNKTYKGQSTHIPIKYKWISSYCNNICNVSNAVSRNNSSMFGRDTAVGKVILTNKYM